MLLLGFILGLAVLVFVVWLLIPEATVSSTPRRQSADQAIRDIRAAERQTIDRLVAAEQAAQNAAASPRSGDDGGSHGIEPRP